MKKAAMIASVLVTLKPAISHAQDVTSGVRVIVGYEYLGLHESYAHNTNPADNFLPNANVPGSAGTTTLNSGSFFKVGIGYEVGIAPATSISLDAGLLAGNSRSQQQNANDSRPAANAAFVYSDASLGFFVEAAVLRHVNKFYWGLSAQLAGVSVDNGWNRFGSDQTQSKVIAMYPSVGPKIGYAFTDNVAAELTVQYGRNVTAAAGLAFKF